VLSDKSSKSGVPDFKTACSTPSTSTSEQSSEDTAVPSLDCISTQPCSSVCDADSDVVRLAKLKRELEKVKEIVAAEREALVVTAKALSDERIVAEASFARMEAKMEEFAQLEAAYLQRAEETANTERMQWLGRIFS
jgi:hypothetical protein